jgi:hypothetical protein
MKFAKLSASLLLVATVFTTALPQSVRADETTADKLADKVQCSDVGLGQNTAMNTGTSTFNSDKSQSGNKSAWGSSSNSSAFNKSSSGGGGGSVSVLGLFSVGGSGGSKSNESGSSKSSNAFGNNSAFNNVNKVNSSNTFDRSTSTLVVGKNCDSNNAAAASMFNTLDNNKTDVKITEIKDATERRRIETTERMNRDNNATQVQLNNSNRSSNQVGNLLKW